MPLKPDHRFLFSLPKKFGLKTIWRQIGQNLDNGVDILFGNLLGQWKGVTQKVDDIAEYAPINAYSAFLFN